MKAFIFVVVMSFFSRCGPGPVEPVNPVNTDTGGINTDAEISTETATGTPCERACENIRLMGCDGAEGSPGPDEQYGNEDDLPCEDVCEEVMNKASFSINPECISRAKSCDEVDECGQ